MEPLIYILDDNPSMTESIAWIIESIGIRVKTFTTVSPFLADLDKNQHACLLLDLRMQEMSGLSVQNKLKEIGAILPIIFMSAYDDVSVVVKALKNGAFDFLAKPFNDNALLESIRGALALDLANRKKILESQQSKIKLSKLSHRELQVLQGIVDGKQNKLISSQLNISLKTIEAHRASLMKKMGIKTVSGLVKFALSQDIYLLKDIRDSTDRLTE